MTKTRMNFIPPLLRSSAIIGTVFNLAACTTRTRPEEPLKQPTPNTVAPPPVKENQILETKTNFELSFSNGKKRVFKKAAAGDPEATHYKLAHYWEKEQMVEFHWTAQEDWGIKLIDLENGEETTPLSVNWSPDFKYFASISEADGFPGYLDASVYQCKPRPCKRIFKGKGIYGDKVEWKADGSAVISYRNSKAVTCMTNSQNDLRCKKEPKAIVGP